MYGVSHVLSICLSRKKICMILLCGKCLEERVVQPNKLSNCSSVDKRLLRSIASSGPTTLLVPTDTTNQTYLYFEL